MPTPAGADAPLVVTAHLDDASFKILDGLRRRHFPAALNRVPAHVSLFHQLPGIELPNVLTTAHAVCAAREGFDLHPMPPRFLGHGVALAFESADLSALHRTLAEAWSPWLTAQDRQPLRAHVTIQNKVTAAEARALFEMAGKMVPRSCRVEGIDVWRYRGGPWEAIVTERFG